MAVDLVCSWSPNPATELITNYKIYLDGSVVGGSVTPSYIITAITPGTHTFEVSAVNVLAEGPKSDPIPVLIPALPSKVSNVQVQISFSLS